MDELWSQLQGWMALYGLKVIGAGVVLLLGLPAARILTRFALGLMRRAKLDETLVSFGGSLLRFLLMALVVIAALNQVGFQTASLVAMLGAAALAVGLAIRNQLSSLAAGVLILFTRPFRVGDAVEVAGVTGTVAVIDILTTRLHTFDGRTVVLPNAQVFGDKIINYVATPTRRIDLVVGVGYGDDLVRAQEVIRQVLEDDPAVLADPEPTVAVLNLGDSSVELAVRPWVNNPDYWTARCRLLEAIKLRLDQEGISIPYPQRDVHLFPAQAAASS
jgi:small conductance mechanosensitive channel